MEFFDKLCNKTIYLLDVLNLENLIYYLSVVPFVLLAKFTTVGWDKSSLKKIVQFKKSVRTGFFLLISRI